MEIWIRIFYYCIFSVSKDRLHHLLNVEYKCLLGWHHTSVVLAINAKDLSSRLDLYKIRCKRK